MLDPVVGWISVGLLFIVSRLGRSFEALLALARSLALLPCLDVIH